MSNAGRRLGGLHSSAEQVRDAGGRFGGKKHNELQGAIKASRRPRPAVSVTSPTLAEQVSNAPWLVLPAGVYSATPSDGHQSLLRADTEDDLLLASHP
jgi:hypothetical protein